VVGEERPHEPAAGPDDDQLVLVSGPPHFFLRLPAVPVWVVDEVVGEDVGDPRDDLLGAGDRVEGPLNLEGTAGRAEGPVELLGVGLRGQVVQGGCRDPAVRAVVPIVVLVGAVWLFVGGGAATPAGPRSDAGHSCQTSRTTT